MGRNESLQLCQLAPDNPKEGVFGIISDVKQSFAAACKEAGIEDCRFHDCGHTTTTKMAQSGISPLELMRVTWHSQLSTLKRYFNQTKEQMKKAAAALEQFHAAAGEPERPELLNRLPMIRPALPASDQCEDNRGSLT